MSKAKGRRWFLPQTPDVLGMLERQAAVTAEGMDAFARWAAGDQASGEAVRESEHRADAGKRDLAAALREAFTTPLEPEDLFALSRELDEVLNGAKDTVREAEALGLEPDAAMAQMAALLSEGVGHLHRAFGLLGGHGDATEAAEAAIKAQRHLERAYRTAMPALLESGELREVVGRQELYRRFTAMSDQVCLVADRVDYATVKES